MISTRKIHPVKFVIGGLLLTITLFILLGRVAPTQASMALQAEPTPLPNPLETPLPTPAPNPVSAWRPPLYPIPWALTENDHFYLIRPILANEVNWPLSAYLYGDINFDPNRPHTGVDIVVDEGTPVVAAGPGTVVWAGFGLFLGGQDDSDPYGKAIAIRHDYGYKDQQLYTIYAHNSQVYVVRGQHVEAGQVIAASGNTGLTTAPHLHFEVRIGLNYFYDSYNPILWMSPPQGWGVLVGRVTTTWGELVDGLQIRVTNVTTLEHKIGKSYGTDRTINPDPYYNENFVLGDLPAGTYEIMVPYFGSYFRATIQIRPGAITYFNFNGFQGFNTNPPPVEIPANLPVIEQ